jgi:Xaa-Pro aminopeptidase
VPLPPCGVSVAYSATMASASEIRRRHDRLLAAMDAAGLDAVVVAGNTEFQQKGYIRYFADWRLYGGTAFLVVRPGRAPALVLGLGAQAEWAKELSAIPDTRAVLDKIDGVVAALLESGAAPRRVGVVGLKTVMSHGDAVRLAAALAGAALEDATDLVEGFWGELSAEGLADVEAAHARVARIFDAFKAALAPGRGEREVVADAYAVAVRQGCLEGVIHLNPGLGGGTRPASERRVAADDIYKMFMEFLTPEGCLIELGGCFSFRPPPAAWRDKHDLVARAIAAAMDASRPGRVADDIVTVIRRTYEESGAEIVGRRLWDFHGQGMHSLLRPFGLPGSLDPIRADTMINIHPGLLTADGLGISATSNYVVTRDGGRPLGGFRHEWHVVG